MTPNFPDIIKDNSRFSLAAAARLLELDTRTLKKYAAILGISRHERKVGGLFYEGKDLRKIWTRIA